MGYDETDYVYKIQVQGTGIKEYYELEDPLPADQVKDLWLSDAEANHGGYLPKVLDGRVSVVMLTEYDGQDFQKELKPEPEPLPAPENYDEEI